MRGIRPAMEHTRQSGRRLTLPSVLTHNFIYI